MSPASTDIATGTIRNAHSASVTAHCAAASQSSGAQWAVTLALCAFLIVPVAMSV
ncbi:ABC transporter permease, partial [Burkholderia pseudomallei]|nr:ABC transporter permease [Burkholderia pseudomallei]